MATLPTLWDVSRGSERLSAIGTRDLRWLFAVRWLKRVVDVLASLVSLVLLSPLLAVTALLIRCTSPGPIFYGQQRIGRHGRMFTIWKFRSMRADADAALAAHIAANPQAQEEWLRDHKLKDDPRVTQFGAFLRRTSIDELPQLWNVLKGDMSLVGPRPIVKDEAARYGRVFHSYTKVKPGITGLWQVSGRNDVDYNRRVLLDQFYIRHWSPWLDMYVIAKTIVAVTARSGAY
jgi:Undecaprenyl-phosphate galactose phosphotransferase WbaP